MSQAGRFISDTPPPFIATQYTEDIGVATPMGNNLNVLGLPGGSVTTTGVLDNIFIAVSGTTDHTIQVGNAAGSLTSLPLAANGEIPIGSVGADPVIANITAGANVTVTNGPGSIMISAAAGLLTWNEVVAAFDFMAVGNGYISNFAAAVLLTLPAVSVVGDVVRVTGKGVGGWRIIQGGGQQIFFGNQQTTIGIAGELSSTNRRDSVELVCVTANTEWNVLSSIGNLLVV